jgi:hypothetical protein
MKSRLSLTYFCVSLIIFSLISFFSTVASEKLRKEDTMQGYFWVQRFYPGNDALDNLKESEYHTRQMFFELNKEILFFAKSLERIQDIEGKKLDINN